MATKLYATWKEIEEIRKKQKFTATDVKLQVQIDKDSDEYIFGLVSAPTVDKTESGGSLPWGESSRKKSLQGLKVYARLYINGMKVSQTKAHNVLYPSLDLDLSEMF